jgi:hypothetical protein
MDEERSDDTTTTKRGPQLKPNQPFFPTPNSASQPRPPKHSHKAKLLQQKISRCSGYLLLNAAKRWIFFKQNNTKGWLLISTNNDN